MFRSIPFVPAKAGTQGQQNERLIVWPLDSRLRGNERNMDWLFSAGVRAAIAC